QAPRPHRSPRPRRARPLLVHRQGGVATVPHRAPPLTVARILQWADAHWQFTGAWPIATAGTIPDGPPGENWQRIENALRIGLRGLPGGASLAQLLARRRGVRNKRGLPQLTEARLLRWARAPRRRTGHWPTVHSGPVAGAPGEVWLNLNSALKCGGRGLPGGTTLARLLADRLGARPRGRPPRLTAAPVL